MFQPWPTQKTALHADPSEFVTSYAPALGFSAGLGGTAAQAMMAWTGASDSVIYWSCYDVSTQLWSPRQAAAYANSPFHASGSPALALAPVGQDLVMVWAADGGQIQYSIFNLTYSPTGTWGQPNPVSDGSTNFQCRTPPAIVSILGGILMVWLDDVLYFSVYQSNGPWTPKTKVGVQRSDGTPMIPGHGYALAATRTTVMLALSDGDSTDINCCLYDAANRTWQPPQTAVGFDNVKFSSVSPPALTSLMYSQTGSPDRILIAWSAGMRPNNQPYFSLYDPSTQQWTSPQWMAGTDFASYLVDPSTGAALTQITSSQAVLAAWKQTDKTINYALCPGTPYQPWTWMQFLGEISAGLRQQSFGQLTLKEISLPGSHDSAMYEVTGFFAGSSIAKGNATTQSNAIYRQLTCGVRFFDLRPSWYLDDFYLYHGPALGPRLTYVLDDLISFMNFRNCREIVILKFSHYDNFDAQGVIYSQFLKRLTDASQTSNLSQWLFVNTTSTRLADLPLSAFTADGRGKIIVVCDGTFPIQNKQNGIYTYRDGCLACPQETDRTTDPTDGDLRIFDCYSNTTDLSAMTTDQITTKYESYTGQCTGANYSKIPCDLFMLGWTLTPAWYQAVLQFADPANNALASTTISQNANWPVPNIVSVDFCDSRVMDFCMRLNPLGNWG